jgi:hypothetical protein
MEIAFLKKIIWSQLGASVKMLENAISSCPDKLWADGSLPKPYWSQVYHSLFYLDLYLSESPTLMNSPSRFKPLERGPAGPVPPKAYSREEMLEYLEYGRAKAKATIDALTEEAIITECAFSWVGVSVAELFFYNSRHVQHHAAQLNLIMRQRIDASPGWVFKAE